MLAFEAFDSVVEAPLWHWLNQHKIHRQHLGTEPINIHASFKSVGSDSLTLRITSPTISQPIVDRFVSGGNVNSNVGWIRGQLINLNTLADFKSALPRLLNEHALKLFQLVKKFIVDLPTGNASLEGLNVRGNRVIVRI